MTIYRPILGSWISSMRQLSYRILLASWFLSAFVLITAYPSLLIARLTLLELLPVPKPFDDLAYGRPQKILTITEKDQIRTIRLSW